ncbi:MAG: aldo/keto reductase [Candidatus Hydrogenedentes bacterium]|nr:aldo/keto reductase [Candidatus Hydrogenedentota bacterium]
MLDSMSRRTFVRTASGAVAGLATGMMLSAPAARAAAVPQATLGRTGAMVSRLGIGASPFRRASITIDDVSAMLHRGLELGVTYIDSAPEYADVKNNSYVEPKIGEAMKGIRDKLFIVTKTEEQTYEGTWRLLRQSLKDFQTDYLDVVHLHNFGQESRFPDLGLVFSDGGALGALREAKKQGVIRFIGASGHLYPSRFHAAFDTGEIDVLMNAVNFVVQHTYDFENKVWARARQENVGLVAMKVLGGAPNSQDKYIMPEDFYERAIRYALTIPNMACAVIGVKNIAELEQLAQTIAGATPLTGEESLELAKVGLDMANLPQWRTPYGTPLV